MLLTRGRNLLTRTLDVRQCILYDSPNPGARLIGIEYMITSKLFQTLDAEERKLWHSHVFEVKSGMLIMPQPSVLVPQAAWEKAETAEMEDVVELYGKVKFDAIFNFVSLQLLWLSLGWVADGGG